MKCFLLTLLGILSFTAFAGVFEDAKWIGAPGDCMPFYPDYLPVFRIDCDVEMSPRDTCSIVYGANDPRLMNRNLNIYNLQNPKDSTGIRIELSGEGIVSVYRYGYHPDDNGTVPLVSFKECKIIDGINHLSVMSNLGNTEIVLNGDMIGKVGLNPVGNGGDYLAFPVLAGMAVQIQENSNASIANIEIRNFRRPGNVIYRVPGEYTATSVIPFEIRSMPQVMTTFSLPVGKRVRRASANATARGIYDLYINGCRVSDDYFYPGSTQYDKTHLYHSFDVTPFLIDGDNEVVAQLAEGWWSGGSTFVGDNWNFFGDRQSFIAELKIEYSDGTIDMIVTSPESWKYNTDGPLVEGSFFQGEVYDASRNGVRGSDWKPAVEIAVDSTVNNPLGNWTDVDIRETYGDRVIAVDTLKAVSMREPRPGVYVYDFGQNMAALPLVRFVNLDKGQEVTMRYAEVLYPDMEQYAANAGMIMTENLRAAMCRDIYRASGTGKESFSPRFTLHGYRFMEITGIEAPLPLDSVMAIPVSSIHRFKAHYECSDTLVNRLWKNIEWSSLSNFISLPTDCPQRNERLGWMGDISVFAPTATKMADISALLRQYLASVRDCQKDNGKYPDVAPTGFGFGGLLWGSAGITVPWECYRQYGDIELLREHYPSMKRYVEYILSETIDPATGIIVQDRAWGDLADWLSPEYKRTDKSLLWECYFIFDLEIMRQVADILGDEEGAIRYEELRDVRKAFFADNYVDKITGKTIYSRFDESNVGKEIDTQVSYALPIAMGIYDDTVFVGNFLNTVKRHNIADDGTVCQPYSLMTGFIGTAWILEALSKSGHPEMAYMMLTSTGYPSWLYPVTQGATTVWERLDSYTHKNGFGKNNSMNSFNHYSFGSVGNWLLTRSLGINVLPDGTVMVAPEPDFSGSLTHASGWLDIPQGRVESSWRIENGKVEYEITIPEGVCGKFKSPGNPLDISGNPLVPSVLTYTLRPGRNVIRL
ncbi:MAG: glycoside hydrolase family 78 protein [Muribaculaceae bacterium]|nr:glycoside hydrolase family 78 protein [Muribaculaceae bacterium]